MFYNNGPRLRKFARENIPVQFAHRQFERKKSFMALTPAVSTFCNQYHKPFYTVFDASEDKLECF
jgi:hypothetical protein